MQKNKTTKKIITITLILVLLIVTNPIHFIATSQADTTQKQPLDQTKANDRFDNTIEFLLKIIHISALSVGIVKNNELIWTNGYGLYDRENNKAAADDTIYLVASISKMFTATAIMQLYEQGHFDLDDDISDYLGYTLKNPKYPTTNITFRMLLAHQSSLAPDLATYFTKVIPGGLEISGYPHPFLQELLTPEGIYYRPQLWNDYAPGEDMYYSNIGFGVLGFLVQQISGQPLEDYCRDNIFTPLGMNDTSFFFSNIDNQRAAVPYEYIQHQYIPYIHYHILEYPAGNLRTTVLDLSRFLILQMNNGTYENTEILTPNTLEEMHTIQYPSDTYNFQYGLGFQIWQTPTTVKTGHTGGFFGVATKMICKKSDDVGIIMFANKGVELLIESAIFSLIEELLFQKATNHKYNTTWKSELAYTLKENTFLFEDFRNYRNIPYI